MQAFEALNVIIGLLTGTNGTLQAGQENIGIKSVRKLLDAVETNIDPITGEVSTTALTLTPTSAGVIISDPPSNADAYLPINVIAEPNFTSGNIKKGVKVWGITGTYEDDPNIISLQVKGSPVQMTYNDSTIDGYKPVVVTGEPNLIAGNIKSGVSIYDVVGTYTATPNIKALNVTPSNVDQTFNENSYDGYKPVTVFGDDNLSPDNIVAGVSIFGVEGTAASATYQHRVMKIANVIENNTLYFISDQRVPVGPPMHSWTEVTNFMSGTFHPPVSFTDGGGNSYEGYPVLFLNTSPVLTIYFITDQGSGYALWKWEDGSTPVEVSGASNFVGWEEVGGFN